MTPEDLPDIDSLWDFQNPAGSETRFRELAQEPRTGEQAAYLACVLSQLARALGLQRRFDEAEAVLAEAESVAARAAPAPSAGECGVHPFRVRLLLERGRVLNSSGDKTASIPYFLDAWNQALAAGEEFLAVDAAHMLGIVETPDAALEWNHRAIRHAEQAAAPRARRWLGSLYNNTGWTHFERGELGSALAMFEQCLAFHQAAGRVRETRIAGWSIARVLREQGDPATALSRQQALEAEWAESGGQDGFVFEELGECLLALGRGEEARPWFARAHALLSQDVWLQAEEPARLARLRTLGGAP